MFDVQVKRIHEYKRQLLNAFDIVLIYLTSIVLFSITLRTCLSYFKRCTHPFRLMINYQ